MIVFIPKTFWIVFILKHFDKLILKLFRLIHYLKFRLNHLVYILIDSFRKYFD